MTVLTGDVLLAPDEVVLYPAAGLDEHGWRLPGGEPSWEGHGNLQLGPGLSDPRAAGDGGRGPFGPARDQGGQIFLPADEGLTVEDGQVAVVRGRAYALSQARLVIAPQPHDPPLACWTAVATSFDRWPEGGEPRA